MFDYIRSWFTVKKSEKGQDLAEYALLLGLIALVVILAVTLLGGEISIIFHQIQTVLQNAAVP